MKPEGTEPHFVLPLAVYDKYRNLIDSVTGGKFDPHAKYNIVYLYTDPENSQKAGTVMYGTELDGLITAYSNYLDEIAREPDPQKQAGMFNGAHSYFRDALFVERRPGIMDPCASVNPLPDNVLHRPVGNKKKWWKRLM